MSRKSDRLPQFLTYNLPPWRWLAAATCKSANSFIDGMDMAKLGWSVILYSALSYDFHNFSNPDTRYQASVRGVVLGISENYDYNHAALAANFGGDIPAWSNFWPWTFVISAIISSGCIFAYASRSQQHGLMGYYADELEARTRQQKIFQDLICASPLITPFYWRLYRLEQILIRRQVDPQAMVVNEIGSMHEELSILRILGEKSSYHAKLSAISALANIYYHRSQTDGADAVAAYALRILQTINRDYCRGDPFAKIYIHYRLWSIGQSTNPLAHILGYLIISPLRLFAVMRLWSLVVNKINLLINFIQARRACHNQDKNYDYIQQVGKFVCNVCYSWQFVDYKRSQNATECVGALLALPQDSQQLMARFTSIKALVERIEVVDLSSQSWPQWPLADWQSLMTILKTPPFNQLLILNLSQPFGGDYFAIPLNLLTSLVDYLQSARIRIIDLSNLNLGQQGTAILLPGLSGNFTATLNFSGNWMSDSTLLPCLPAFTAMPALQTLVLSYNSLTGYSLEIMAQSLNISAITTLDVGYNYDLTAGDIEQFSSTLNTTELTTLDVSGIDFSRVDISKLGNNIGNSWLTTFTMANCKLSAQQAAGLLTYISHSFIRQLNLAGNYLSYLPDISADLVKIKELDLSYSGLVDADLNLLAKALATPGCSLIRLTISGNFITPSGFKALATALKGSLLQILEIARNQLGDDGITVLISALPARNLPLLKLDVGYNALSSTGVNQLFYYVANSSLSDLSLDGNPLDGDLSASLPIVLSYGALQKLSLGNTGISGETLKSAFGVLKMSPLQKFYLYGNNLDDTVAIALGECLISPLPNLNTYLSSFKVNPDFSRALDGATNATQLAEIIFPTNLLTGTGGRALCLPLPGAGIDTQNLILTGPTWYDPATTGVIGCPVPVVDTAVFTSAAAPNHSISWLLMALLILLVLRPGIAGIVLRDHSAKKLAPACRKLGLYAGGTNQKGKNNASIISDRISRKGFKS